MPYIYAVYVYRICMPYMYTVHVFFIRKYAYDLLADASSLHTLALGSLRCPIHTPGQKASAQGLL